MADDIKESKVLEKAMVALLDDMAHIETRSEGLKISILIPAMFNSPR